MAYQRLEPGEQRFLRAACHGGKRKADGDTIVVEEFELYDIKVFGVRPKVEKVENESVEEKVEQKENRENHKKDKKKFDKKKDDVKPRDNKINQPKEMVLGGEDVQNKNQKNAENSDKNGFKNKGRGKFFHKNNKK